MYFEKPQELPINDAMRDDMLYRIARSDPWYADIVNFMVARYVRQGADMKRLIYESRHHLCDEPYPFRVCSDGLLRRCVPAEEGMKIIEKCHSSPYGGHYGAFRTHAKIWQSGFSGQLCIKTQKISYEGATLVRGMKTSIPEMPCH
jgi:hypothetical protein